MATDQARQQPMGGISRRSVLRGGLLAGAGVATVGAASTVFTETAKADSGRQPTWLFCPYCRSLWWGGGNSQGACPATGLTHGTGSGDYEYGVDYGIAGLDNNTDPQPGFRFCNQCFGLFWKGRAGYCYGNVQGGVVGSHHAGSTTDYDLTYGGPNPAITNPQPGWRWCGSCSLIYWQGSSGSEAGTCAGNATPSGFGPHGVGSSTMYWMYWYGYLPY